MCVPEVAKALVRGLGRVCGCGHESGPDVEAGYVIREQSNRISVTGYETTTASTTVAAPSRLDVEEAVSPPHSPPSNMTLDEDDFDPPQNTEDPYLLLEPHAAPEPMQLDSPQRSLNESHSGMDVEGQTMMSIELYGVVGDNDTESPSASVHDHQDTTLEEGDILPGYLTATVEQKSENGGVTDAPTMIVDTAVQSPTDMSKSPDPDFFEQLLSNLATIPVPPAFTIRDVDPLEFAVEVLEFVGFNTNVSNTLAISLTSSTAMSLSKHVVEWMIRRWRELEADLCAADDHHARDDLAAVALKYESLGLVREFAHKCASCVIFDPLSSIIDIVEESIKDAITLRDCHLQGFISCSSRGTGKGKGSIADEKATPVPFDKNVCHKFVDGRWVSVDSFDKSDTEKMYPDPLKWNYDECENVTGYRSFSQEAAVDYQRNGGFAPSNTHTQRDLFGTEPSSRGLPG